jgi:hypothetical protein
LLVARSLSVPRQRRQALAHVAESAGPANRVDLSHQCGGSLGERFLRTYYAELVSLGIGQYSPGLCASLPDVDPACPECDKPLNLLVAVLGTAGQIEVHAILDRLQVGDWHEAHADGRILVGPYDDLTLPLGQNLPAERLGPEPGQPRQVVSVNDDVMQSDRHAVSMRGHATRCVHTWHGG